MGLLGELKKYVKDALPGGLLNPEVSSQGILDGAALSTTAVPVLGDLLGLGADLHRYKNEPESRTFGNFALSGLGMLPFVPAMTAWHGSPHKFDKFSLDKIGTGEGAQAYGHGLYLAESPEVAKTYKVGGQMGPEKTANYYLSIYKTPDNAMSVLEDELKKQNLTGAAREYTQSVYDLLKQGKATNGNLYKTDIPDEAVARFLDWDKPLSQQAPEVQAAINGIRDAEELFKGRYATKMLNPTGADVNETLADVIGNPNGVSQYLRDAGIPGIRYLDGGSRSAGQGSSNFVVFDDKLPRILERNGVPTGQQPWKPGEWQGLLGR